MQGLVELNQWAEAWQQGVWSCATLPRDLGASLVIAAGGTSILGMSLRSSRTIGINDLLVDSALFMPVVLHEAGHLLTEPLKTSADGCYPTWLDAGAEMLAWCGAGRLSVSLVQGDHLDRGEVSLDEIALLNGVPHELIAIGQAIIHQFSRPLSPVENRAELLAALQFWHGRMALVVRSLMSISAACWAVVGAVS